MGGRGGGRDDGSRQGAGKRWRKDRDVGERAIRRGEGGRIARSRGAWGRGAGHRCSSLVESPRQSELCLRSRVCVPPEKASRCGVCAVRAWVCVCASLACVCASVSPRGTSLPAHGPSRVCTFHGGPESCPIRVWQPGGLPQRAVRQPIAGSAVRELAYDVVLLWFGDGACGMGPWVLRVRRVGWT